MSAYELSFLKACLSQVINVGAEILIQRSTPTY